jgi:acetyl esterase
VRSASQESHSLPGDVAELPRLSPKAEHRVLKVGCGLPASAQRVLFGRPPVLDGQVLASDIQALIRLSEWAGSESITECGPPAEARANSRLGAEAVRGPQLPMAQVDELELPGPAGPIPMRFYVPSSAVSGGLTTPEGGQSSDRRPPLLVYFHGGGWVIGDLDTHDGLCRFLAANAGVLVLSVDYRLAPEHPFPAAVEDAFAAFVWAAEQAVGLGADPHRVAVGGDSAGGNLAAVVSILTRDAGGPDPAMQLLIYPVTDTEDSASRRLFAKGFLLTKADMDWFEGHYLPSAGAAEDPRVSVLRTDDLSGLPPAYVATAGFDPLRDEGEAYAERMRAAGVRVALRRHPGLVHSFANLTAVSRTSRAAMLEVAGALRMGLS